MTNTKTTKEATLKRVIALYRDFTGTDHVSAIMDIESVDKEFPMDWELLLNEDGFDRTHDFAGIHRHLIRDSYPAKMGDCFVPRFARRSRKS